MELRLQKLIASLEQLSNIYNIDDNNPLRFVLEHPVTNVPYVIVASIVEPNVIAALPRNGTWVVFDPNSRYYRQALKYKGTAQDSSYYVSPNGNSWQLLTTYDAIFSEPLSSGAGTEGPTGPVGPAGAKGLDGDIDYQSIVDTVIPLVNAARLIPQSIVITGANTVLEGRTTQLTATVTYVNGTSANVTTSSTWSVNNANGSVNTTGLFTGNTVSADSLCTVTVSYTNLGVTVQSTHGITVQDAIPSSIAINGASNVNENTSSTYTATVTWNNGATSSVTPTWGLSTPTLGSINSGGVLSAASVSANTSGNVTAAFTYMGNTVNGSKAITVVNVPTVVYPYYGLADMSATKNEAFILALSSRGPNASRLSTFTLDAQGPTIKMYYAYPVSYGPATFVDTSNGFEGGWDGVIDPFTNTGPITINVTVDGAQVPFYLYGTDMPNIGAVTWQVN
jgi:hypothetical protein